MLVLGTALLLVTGVAFAVNALTGSPAKDPKVSRAAAKSDSEKPSAEKSSGPGPANIVKVRKRKRAASTGSSPTQSPQLAEPKGRCDPEDIAVSPFVGQAGAWRANEMEFELKTRRTEACYWQVSARALTVAITNKYGEVWTSRQCPGAVPVSELVLRNDVGVKIALTWSGRLSDEECSNSTRWAAPGWYRLEAAAFGGEPGQVLFQLKRPQDLAPESLTAQTSPSATSTPSGTAH